MPPERFDAVDAGMVEAFDHAYLSGDDRDAAFEAFLTSLPEVQFQSTGGRRSP